MNHLQLGQTGEDLAASYLYRKGMKIIQRNYRFGKGELDILCEAGDQLVVVEVKTRTSSVYGQPYISVSYYKQRQIIELANKFIYEKGIDLDVRFDVVSVIHNSFETKIEHIEGAFGP